MSLAKDLPLELGSQAWLMLEDGESSDSMGSYSSSFLSFFSGHHFCAGGNREALSFVNYGAVSVPGASVLSFEHEDRDWVDVDAIEQSYKLESGCRMAREQESFGFAFPSARGKRQCEDPCEKPIPKKQCSRKMKEKSISTLSKDSSSSQSVAAKNRRERISERLKILQDLVPNGTKVDLVTMLEKAISYVKFLQLQVKVLATDEFWPVQGGRTPDIGQVKKVLDAILSSQRDSISNKH